MSGGTATSDADRTSFSMVLPDTWQLLDLDPRTRDKSMERMVNGRSATRTGWLACATRRWWRTAGWLPTPPTAAPSRRKKNWISRTNGLPWQLVLAHPELAMTVSTIHDMGATIDFYQERADLGGAESMGRSIQPRPIR